MHKITEQTINEQKHLHESWAQIPECDECGDKKTHFVIHIGEGSHFCGACLIKATKL